MKNDTNVRRFPVLYNGKAGYVGGVGSRFGFVGKMLRGITGAGA